MKIRAAHMAGKRQLGSSSQGKYQELYYNYSHMG